ncbi:hypothetical protein NDN08_005086 [Rhodosorus marinus]|uniref:HEAT repeat-containing protein 1 n=1 Tax=Rhodosorus marinus TaxID=101924 RepID=A0AAV8V412_9RHOD|nr:hypothetical protein NDN08_005086 [Rhodosorus marinus]
MEEVEFDARDFARAVGSGGSAASGVLRQFRVLMEKHHESDGTSVDAAAAYLEYRPGADEVLQWIDVEHKSISVAALRALIYLVNAKTGKSLARSVLRNRSRRLYNILTNDMGRMTRLVLDLFITISRLSVPHARDITTRFNLGDKDLIRLVARNSPTRPAFLELLAALLGTGDHAVIVSILVKTRRMVISVLKDIAGDNRAATGSKPGERELANVELNEEFFNAYGRALLALNSDELVRRAVAAPVLELVCFVACISTSKRLRTIANDLVLQFTKKKSICTVEDVANALHSTPMIRSESLDLVRATLHGRTGATASFLRDSRLTLADPRRSVSWMTSAALLISALSVSLPKNCSRDDVLPGNVFEASTCEKSLVHSDNLIRFTTLQFLVAVLRRLESAKRQGIAEIQVHLPGSNTVIAAAKFAIQKGGLFASVGIESLRLVLELGVLGESRANIAKLVFSDSDSLLGSSSLLATSELLRITDVLLQSSWTSFFSGSDQKRSLFGKLLSAFANASSRELMGVIGTTLTSMLSATGLYPGGCESEVHVWVHFMQGATDEMVSVIDQLVCEAVRRPHALMDDLLEATREAGLVRPVNASTIPFSLIAVGAVRRAAKIVKTRPEGSHAAEQLGKSVLSALCRMISAVLCMQIEYRPFAWLIVNKFDDDKMGLVTFAKELIEGRQPTRESNGRGDWIYSEDAILPNRLEESLHNSHSNGQRLSSQLSQKHRLPSPDAIHGAGKETVDMNVISDSMLSEPADVVVRRIGFRLTTGGNSSNSTRADSMLLMTARLAELFPFCADQTKSIVLKNLPLSDVGYSYFYNMLELLVCAKYDPEVYAAVLRRMVDGVAVDDQRVELMSFATYVLGKSKIPPVLRGQLIRACLEGTLRARLDNEGLQLGPLEQAAFASLVAPDLDDGESEGHIQSTDSPVVYSVILEGLVESKAGLLKVAQHCVRSTNLVLKSTAILAAALNSDRIAAGVFADAGRMRCVQLCPFVEKCKSLRLALLQGLQMVNGIDRRNWDGLVNMIPLCLILLKRECNTDLLVTFDVLYSQLLIEKARDGALTTTAKQFMEDYLTRIVKSEVGSSSALSQLVKVLSRTSRRQNKEPLEKLTNAKRPGLEGPLLDVKTMELPPPGVLSIDTGVLMTIAMNLRGERRLRKRCFDASCASLRSFDIHKAGALLSCLSMCSKSSVTLKNLLKRTGRTRLRKVLRSLLKHGMNPETFGAEFSCVLLKLFRELFTLQREAALDATTALELVIGHSRLETCLRGTPPSSRQLCCAVCVVVTELLQTSQSTTIGRTIAKLASEVSYVGTGDPADIAVAQLVQSTGLPLSEISAGPYGNSIRAVEAFTIRKSELPHLAALGSCKILGTACKALSRALAPPGTEVVDVRRLIENGVLDICLMQLSSEDEGSREEAYSFLQLLYDIVSLRPDGTMYGSANLFRERKQLLFFLELLRNSIAEPLFRFPGIVSYFLTRTVAILMRPSHTLFPTVMRFLLKRPTVSTDDIIFISRLINLSESGTALHQARLMAIECVQFGTRSKLDRELLRKRHIYEQLMLLVTADSYVGDSKVRTKALQALISVAEHSAEVAMELVRRHGLFAWISLRVDTLKTYAALVEYCRLLHSVCRSNFPRDERLVYAGQAGSALSSIVRRFLKVNRTGNEDAGAGDASRHILSAFNAITTMAMNRRGSVSLYPGEALLLEKACSDLQPNQSGKILSYSGFTPTDKSSIELVRIASTCFKALASEKEPEDFPSSRSDMLSCAAAGSEIVCLALSKKDLESANFELKWSVAAAMLSCEDRLVTRVLFVAALRIALSQPDLEDIVEERMLDIASRTPSPSTLFRNLGRYRKEELEELSSLSSELCGLLMGIPQPLGRQVMGEEEVKQMSRKRKSS